MINSSPGQRGVSQRLFSTCFAALVATSFGFVLRTMVVDNWGQEFALSETQKGELLGVGLWPFAISIGLFSLIIDRINYRVVMGFALACHLVSAAITMAASGYWTLYVGTFIVALGNGAVEAAVNPAIASAYAHDKTRWLNRLHAGWPGGLLLGGLLVLALGDSVDWRFKIALILLPTITYGCLLLRQDFPVSERVASGVPWRAMLGEVGVLGALLFAGLTVLELGRVFDWAYLTQAIVVVVLVGAFALVARAWGRPVFLVLVLLMIPLATTELGTDSWITDLMTPAMHELGLAGGWVLVWASFLVMVLRLYAGPFVHRLTALGLLAASSLVAALGLWMMSKSSGIAILAAAIIYGAGKAFWWPTMLGVVAERFPRGGALTLNLTAGVGMLSVGIVGAVFLGRIQDTALARAAQSYDTTNRTELSERYLMKHDSSLFGSYLALDSKQMATAPESEARVLKILQADTKRRALRTVAILPLGMAIGFGLLLFWLRRRSSAQIGRDAKRPAVSTSQP